VCRASAPASSGLDWTGQPCRIHSFTPCAGVGAHTPACTMDGRFAACTPKRMQKHMPYETPPAAAVATRHSLLCCCCAQRLRHTRGKIAATATAPHQQTKRADKKTPARRHLGTRNPVMQAHTPPSSKCGPPTGNTHTHTREKLPLRQAGPALEGAVKQKLTHLPVTPKRKAPSAPQECCSVSARAAAAADSHPPLLQCADKKTRPGLREPATEQKGWQNRRLSRACCHRSRTAPATTPATTATINHNINKRRLAAFPQPKILNRQNKPSKHPPGKEQAPIHTTNQQPIKERAVPPPCKPFMNLSMQTQTDARTRNSPKRSPTGPLLTHRNASPGFNHSRGAAAGVAGQRETEPAASVPLRWIWAAGQEMK
jgi:hypothetical protein